MSLQHYSQLQQTNARDSPKVCALVFGEFHQNILNAQTQYALTLAYFDNRQHTCVIFSHYA